MDLRHSPLALGSVQLNLRAAVNSSSSSQHYSSFNVPLRQPQQTTMSVRQLHRTQSVLMRPNVARFSTRATPNARRNSRKGDQVMQLTLHRPSRTPATVGALVGIGVFALHRDLAKCQAIVFAEISGGSGGAGGSARNSDDKKDDDLVNKLIEQVTSRFGEITFGGALGFCSGYAVKQVGKIAACSIGVIFLMAQVASSQGYIDINWKKVESDVIRAVDPDGDGKLTQKDLKHFWNKFMNLVQYNLPSSSGFAGGFVIGVSCS